MLVPHGVDAVFDVVNDVEHYQQFLPGCIDSQILPRNETEYVAQLDLSIRGLREKVITRNTLSPPHELKMRLVEGPFEYLTGVWQLVDLGEGCRVSLELDFEFESRLLNLSTGGLLQRGIARVVDAFVAEVRARHER